MVALHRSSASLIALAALLMISPSLAQTTAPSSPGLVPLQARPKVRIAVLNFDFSNIGLTGAVYSFTDSAGPSKAVSTLLTNLLVKDGTYVVIERSRIDAVLAEQNLGQAGRLEPTTAAQVGRILGVDAVVIGSVTEFGLEQKKGGVNILGFGSQKQTQIARVQLAARIVSTTTGEILSVAEAKGEATQVDESLAFGGYGSTAQGSNASDRLLATAAQQALEEVKTKFVSEADKLAALPPVVPLIETLVAHVAGAEITFNKGGTDGLRPGMILQVERVSGEIRDPATGKVLTRKTTPLGRVQLMQVQPNFSIGKVLRGQGFKVGDVAKAVQ